ncbi:MAG TPA: hypothetical protein VGG43_13290 [Acidimicrobiales bacterium]
METFTRRLRPSLSTLAALILGLGAVGVALVATSLPAAAAAPCSAPTGTNPFTVTCPVGIADTWVVPANVSSATFTVFGAEGGTSTIVLPGVTAGNGGELSATLSVATGATYDIAVGAAGGNGTLGSGGAGGAPGGAAGDLGGAVGAGGGGGASTVALSTAPPDTWLLVGGGGGGAGNDGPPAGNGGVGGGSSGGNGGDGAAGGTQASGSGSGTQLDGSSGTGDGAGGGGGYWGGAGDTIHGGAGAGDGHHPLQRPHWHQPLHRHLSGGDRRHLGGPGQCLLRHLHRLRRGGGHGK